MDRLGWHSDASKEQSDPDGEARKRFHAYTGGDLSALSADLRSSVFDIKETFGEAGNAKLLHDLYNKSDFAGKRSDCLGAMGLVSRLSAIGLGRRKCAISGFSLSVSQCGERKPTDCLAVLTRQVGLFVEQVLGDDIGLHVCGVISQFQSESMAVEVEAFMVGNNTLRYKRRLEEALEGMRSKVLFAVATILSRQKKCLNVGGLVHDIVCGKFVSIQLKWHLQPSRTASIPMFASRVRLKFLSARQGLRTMYRSYRLSSPQWHLTISRGRSCCQNQCS
ncbi:hypothetical protein Plhal703r1_c41g0141571 [Plasmopara halstedii]